MKEPTAYCTEWSKSERERQILHIKTHKWKLERWYRWSYLQGSKGDTEAKNKLLDSVVGEGGMICENSFETYITKCKIDNQCKFDVWHKAPKASALW